MLRLDTNAGFAGLTAGGQAGRSWGVAAARVGFGIEHVAQARCLVLKIGRPISVRQAELSGVSVAATV